MIKLAEDRTMDAAYASHKKIALLLFLAIALLIPAAAYGQPQLMLSSTAVTIAGQQPGFETVTSSASPTTQIAFSLAAAYASGDPSWVCVSNDSVPNSAAVTLPNTGTAAGNFPTPVNLAFNVCPTEPFSFFGTPGHVYSATITAAPAAGDTSGATPVTFTVSYTVGSSGAGGGGGTLTINPATPGASTCFGCTTSFTFTATPASTSLITFSLSTPSVPWVTQFQQSNGTTNQFSSSSPATFTVSLNGALGNQGTLSTQLVINYSGTSQAITISFGNGTGSGTTSGSLQVSQSTVSLAFSSGGSLPSASVGISDSAASTWGFNVLACTGNWLLASGSGGLGQSSGSGFVLPGTLTLVADSNAETLAAGQYTCNVTVSGSDNSSITISAVLTVNGAGSSGLTLSPSPVSLTASNGAQQIQQVTITSTTGGSVAASISGAACGCLTVSAPANSSIAANASTTVTITANPSGLAANTYGAQLVVTVGATTQTDAVNFIVGSGSSGGSSTIIAAPATLNFYQEAGLGGSPSEPIYLAGSGNYSAAITTANGTNFNWLSVSSLSGTLPVQNGNLSISTNTTGLPAGTYTGTVTFTNTTLGGTSSIGVNLNVTNTAQIYTSPGSVTFNYIAGTTSTSQTYPLNILTTDGSSLSATAAVSNPSGTPWLSLQATSATSYLITANASGLANGVYTGFVTVTGTFPAQTITVPVVLGVVGSSVTSGSGSLTLSQSSLTLQAQVNGLSTSQSLTVSATTATTFNVTSQVNTGTTTWLSVSPAGSNTTNTTLMVSANPAGLAAGTYTGDIYLTANNATQTVPITLVVSTTGGVSGNITVTANGGTSSSPSLTFTASAVGATVPTQYLSVASALGFSGVTFQASATTTSGGNWIALSTAAATLYSTPYSPLTITVSTTGLAAGTYSGSVIVAPTGGAPAVTVPVTLTIAGAAIAVSQSSLTFSYQAGGLIPNTQAVTVTTSNSGSGAFTAVPASSGGWLAVTPSTGVTPASLTVSVAPTGLAAGTYTGSITVTGSSGASGTATISVTLTVTVPLPTITAVVNGASFAGGSIAPGEIITLGGTSIGPATPASFSLTSSGNNLFVPSTLGGVQVLFNGQYPAPLLYVSASQINAIVPYEIAGILSPTVMVKFLGQTSASFSVNAAATAAGIFTASGTGTGPGAILNFDGSVNSSSNPAPRGTPVVLFMTGEGQTSPTGVDGKVTTAPFPAPLLPVAVTIGGSPATVQFIGEAPGLVSGVLQLNVLVPSTLTTTGAVPVSVTFGTSSSSQGGVTVNLK